METQTVKDRFLGALPKGNIKNIKTIAKQTGIIPARIKREVTKLVESEPTKWAGHFSNGELIGIRRLPKREERPTVIDIINGADINKLGDLLTLLVDHIPLEQGNQQAILLIRSRRFLFSHEKIGEYYVEPVRAALLTFAGEVQMLLRGWRPTKFKVQYKDHDGMIRQRIIRADKPGIAVSAVKRSAGSYFNLVSVTVEEGGYHE